MSGPDHTQCLLNRLIWMMEASLRASFHSSTNQHLSTGSSASRTGCSTSRATKLLPTTANFCRLFATTKMSGKFVHALPKKSWLGFVTETSIPQSSNSAVHKPHGVHPKWHSVGLFTFTSVSIATVMGGVSPSLLSKLTQTERPVKLGPQGAVERLGRVAIRGKRVGYEGSHHRAEDCMCSRPEQCCIPIATAMDFTDVVHYPITRGNVSGKVP